MAAVPSPQSSLDQAFAHAVEGSILRAVQIARQGLSEAASRGEAEDPTLRAAADVFGALYEMTLGRYEPALRLIGAPLAVLEAGPRRGDLAYVYSCIGFALGKLGDAQSGLQWSARAGALARRTGRVVESIKVLSDEGCLHGLLQHFERSIAKLTEASTLAQKSAPRFAQAACLGNLAFACLLKANALQSQGAHAKALDAARRAADWADRACSVATNPATKPLAGWARTIRARARLHLGRLDEAEADLQEAQTLSAGYTQMRVEVLRGWLALRRQRRQYDQACEALLEAMALCDGEGYEPTRVALLEDAVLVGIEAGNHTEALAWWLRHFDALQSQYKSRQRLEMAQPGGHFVAGAEVRWPDPRRRAPAELQAVEDWLDAATGLLNMRGLEHVGHAAFDAGHGLALAVMCIDGALADATVVARVAAILAAAWQTGFVAARGVGSKFVLLFPELPSQLALVLCERLRAQVQDQGQGTTVSAGFASQEGQADLGAVMADAVRALRSAITQGGNRVVQAAEAECAAQASLPST